MILLLKYVLIVKLYVMEPRLYRRRLLIFSRERATICSVEGIAMDMTFAVR